jgi:hypothetical protein
MMKELQFIERYCAVCHHYDNTLVLEAQRQSNNFRPKFTDEECIAIYIWGLANQKFAVSGCYDFIKDFYGDWFPDLPSYQAYNNRLCYLADAFKALANVLLVGPGLDSSHADFITDSIPVVVAGEKRSSKARTASELCDKGYCASKGMYYYGVKLHTVAQCNYKAMPTPALMMISKASEHDLGIAKDMLDDAANIRVFGDMAFIDKAWQATQAERNATILTPIKRKRGEDRLPFADKMFSAAVSSVKQAIESLNNWLIEKTNIQRASKVPSTNGLIAFLFARIACACFLLNS